MNKMIHNVPKPKISPDFTIDDIHKIREWHYECLKDATLEERKEYYHKGSESILRELGLLAKA
jgi:hypothetical protein